MAIKSISTEASLPTWKMYLSSLNALLRCSLYEKLPRHLPCCHHAICQFCPTLTLLLRHLSHSDGIWFPCLSFPPDGLARLKSLRQEKESYFSLHPRFSSHTELISDLPGVCCPVGSLFESLILESQTSPREVFPPSFLPPFLPVEIQKLKKYSFWWPSLPKLLLCCHN